MDLIKLKEELKKATSQTEKEVNKSETDIRNSIKTKTI